MKQNEATTPTNWKVCLDNQNRVVVSDGLLTEYPVQYKNGQIAYDKPEQIPFAIRDEVKLAFKTLNYIDIWRQNAEEVLPFHLNKK